MENPRASKRRLLRIFLGGVVVIVGTLTWILFFPVLRPPFTHEPTVPAPSHDQAVAVIHSLIEATPAEVRPDARPILLDHGQRTPRAFVLLHGLSNNPAQFADLGRQLFERGHNVFIPRLPYHGEKDRMTESWGRLTAQQMLDTCNQAADLAHGLGDEVVVVGLSVCGTTAAWMAQNRSDLSRTALLSPFLAPAGIPNWATGPLLRVLLRLPNRFLWWNPQLKENNPGPPYAYPRFPTRVIGETMLLGQAVLNESRQRGPACKSIVVVTSAADKAVNNSLTKELIANWRKFEPGVVTSFEFPADKRVPHDFIDKNQPDQQVAVAYPVLLELLEK